MRKLILAAGVAAMAISVPAAAKPDKAGHGHSQVERGGKSKAKAQRSGGQSQAKAQRRGGGQRAVAQRGSRAKAQRGGGQHRVASAERRGKAQRAERRGGGHQRVAQVERRGKAKAQRVERRGGQRFANFQTERHGKTQRVEKRGNGHRDVRVANRGRDNRDVRVQNRGRDNREFRVENRGRDNRRFRVDNRQRDVRIALDRRDRAEPLRVRAFNDDRAFRNRDDFRRIDRWRDWNDRDWDRAYAYRGIPAAYVGCPPGLAKKSPACVPPGRARAQFVGRVLPDYYSANYFPRSLRYIYADTPDYYYRWGDGYAYRVNRSTNLIAALLPLIGAGYGIGQQFPYMSDPYYYVPSDYQSFYPSYGNYGGGDYYRYANGYVYEIDGRSGYIEDVIPLLDRGYGVGQMLPAGYSYYNVPYQYRDYYYDTDDYYYRYAPGAIYQVDRDTQLITSLASLLTGGLAVGQPLPPAYSVYNVPYAYRTTYYDTPNSWYRYSDGYIYQVDPTTQLITAIVRAIV